MILIKINIFLKVLKFLSTLTGSHAYGAENSGLSLLVHDEEL